jgi:hypothetical protein
MDASSVPSWAVPVPVMTLVLAGACDFKTAWRLSHGARLSPFHQNCILQRVLDWRLKRDRALGNAWDVVRLPFLLWKNV